MTTREFIQHLVLNGELDAEVIIEVKTNRDIKAGHYIRIRPAHVCHLGPDDCGCDEETLVECKPIEVE